MNQSRHFSDLWVCPCLIWLAFECKYSSKGKKLAHYRKKLRAPIGDASGTLATPLVEGLDAWDHGVSVSGWFGQVLGLHSHDHDLGHGRDLFLDPWKSPTPPELDSRWLVESHSYWMTLRLLLLGVEPVVSLLILRVMSLRTKHCRLCRRWRCMWRL